MPTGQPDASPIIPVGILYSVSGAFGVLGREMVNGIMLAIEEINADPRYPFTLAPVLYDTAGSMDRLHECCQELLYRHGVQHIFGCYTSAERKRILPLIEGANALLWYSARYEGFESSQNVIYLGASPNQHVLPLLSWLLQQKQPLKIYHVGSNYVWSWEIDRITQEAVEPHDAQLVGSELLPLDASDLRPVIEDIVRCEPNVLLNTMVGESAYRFHRTWQTMAAEHPFLTCAELTRTSLILSEPEIALLGAEAVEGTLVSGVWFQANAAADSPQALAHYQQRFGEHAHPFADSVAAWRGVHQLARALSECPEPRDIDQLRDYVCREQPPGDAFPRIDPENNHAWHTPQLARCRDGQLEVFWQAAEPVRPDPWLTWVDLEDLGHGA